MTPEGSARCHLWIGGLVQGVGFRYFAGRTARRLGLAGVARNLADGRVEVIAEGPQASLESFIAELRAGPSGASVRSVAVTWEPAAGLVGFRIGA